MHVQPPLLLVYDHDDILTHHAYTIACIGKSVSKINGSIQLRVFFPCGRLLNLDHQEVSMVHVVLDVFFSYVIHEQIILSSIHKCFSYFLLQLLVVNPTGMTLHLNLLL